jgi:procollagen-lysine,2-oxoglutarate 5-dioxygenase
LEKFKEAKAKVIFGAENFCWPDDELRSKYPPVDGEGQRFLNSGMFIGYAKNVFNVLSYADVKDTEDDQRFYTHVYLDKKMRSENQIKLDHKSNLFQNLNGNIGEFNGRLFF